MTDPRLSERPRRPLSAKPAGYVGLATYSSLGRLWAMLDAASRAGRSVSVVRGDPPEAARRRISGYTLRGAGLFVDTERLLRDLEDGFETHPALLALMAGDAGPLRDTLNAGYELRLDFTVALTAGRDLILRPEFRYAPLPENADPLPSTVTLRTRRMGRDELHLLFQRACGLA